MRLPSRDKFLWDSERVGEERVDLLRDLDIGEMALAGEDVDGGAADPFGEGFGEGDGHRGVLFAVDDRGRHSDLRRRERTSKPLSVACASLS
jgi:hypothetical protein